MKSLQTNSLTLDTREISILKKTAIPPIFAQFLKEKSLTLGVAFALRVSSSSNRYLMPAAPKPISIKAKIGNWSLAKGIIAVQPELGKIEKQHESWHVIERKATDIPSTTNFLKETLHKVSLQEILTDLRSGELELLGTEEEIRKTGRLLLKSKKHPTNSHIIFSINFKEDTARLQMQHPIDLKKIIVSLPEHESQPTWWNDNWGNFEECLNMYYPAQYKYVNDAIFTDILAYGVEDENKNVLPITGDQDFLWISSPYKIHHEFLKDFSETINTLEPGGIEKLYQARIALHLKLGGNPEDAERSILNSSIAGLGCVTAYESYVIDEINKSFADCGIKHLRNLIQHAAENHNPNKPSSLDTEMVHVWKGKIYLTHNEHELIEFFLQPDYPKENQIDIHPEWNMKEWAPVILMQLTLKQPVSPQTLASYKKYRRESQKTTFLGNDPLKTMNQIVEKQGKLHE